MTNVSTEDVHRMEARLQSCLHGQVRNFRIELRQEGIVLHGLCRTYYAKQLAQEAVRHAMPCRIFLNDIEVA